MSVQLVIDNTDHHNYLGNLMRAICHPTGGAPLPKAFADLICQIDTATIESDLALALKLSAVEGPEKPKTTLGAV